MREEYNVTLGRSVRTGTCVSSSQPWRNASDAGYRGYVYVAAGVILRRHAGCAQRLAGANDVCRGTDARCYHDWAKEKREGNRVLIYTRTAGPRHPNLGPAARAPVSILLSIPRNVVQSSLRAWLARAGIEADWTEDVTRLTNLHRYKAIIFASTSRDALFAHGRAIDPALGSEHHHRRSSRRCEDRASTIHPRRRRLRRHPQRLRHRVQLAVVRGFAGQQQFYDHGPNQDGTVRIVRAAILRPTGCRSPGRSGTSGTTSSRSRRASSFC